MKIYPNSLKEFYIAMKFALSLRTIGINAVLEKSKILKPASKDYANFEMLEKKYPEMFDGIVTFSRSYNEKHEFLMPIKDALTARYKPAGIAKTSGTTRFDFVINDTRKNSLFMMRNVRHLVSRIENHFRGRNSDFLVKNKEALDKMREMHDLSMSRYSYSTTFSKVGTILRKFKISGEEFSMQYNFIKFKHSIDGFYNLNSVNYMVEYIQLIDNYVRLKEESKSIFLELQNGEKIPVYDIVFVPAGDIVSYIAGMTPDPYSGNLIEDLQVTI